MAQKGVLKQCKRIMKFELSGVIWLGGNYGVKVRFWLKIGVLWLHLRSKEAFATGVTAIIVWNSEKDDQQGIP
jgi:hypothetical protein